MYEERRTRWTILSLALGAFAIGVSEFAAMGLLPYYALDYGVPEPSAGHAVSGYALGVVIGAPVLAVLGARVPRKIFLAALIGFFGLANLLSAFMPGMMALTGTRVLAGLPHGAYLGIAMLFAADMLPKGRRAAGVAQVLMGLTLANVVGVPAA
ncbi:MFS transporter, partial [Puniceibacterium confluentis]|uniref:MFS transporter n=1 Tax=Puniceibacterium confluentis TaxID=1958944 RepID=UPI00356565BE